MEQQKDLSLLRPFDLEAAKRGEDFVFVECGELKARKFIAGPDSGGGIVVQDELGAFVVSHAYPYNMAPLCWVEGKPVYKGDVLYQNGERVVAGDWATPDSTSRMTWTPPRKPLGVIHEGREVFAGDRLWNLIAETFATATDDGLVYDDDKGTVRWNYFSSTRWAWEKPEAGATLAVAAPCEAAPREAVFAAITTEREFQDKKWGTIQQHPHEVGGWMTIMRKLLSDAEAAWSNGRGNQGALDELRKVVAVGVACMEQHGAVPRGEV